MLPCFFLNRYNKYFPINFIFNTSSFITEKLKKKYSNYLQGFNLLCIIIIGTVNKTVPTLSGKQDQYIVRALFYTLTYFKKDESSARLPEIPSPYFHPTVVKKRKNSF